MSEETREYYFSDNSNVPHYPKTSKKYTLGQRVVGQRAGRICAAGTLVEMYYTLNGSYKNAAYVVQCDDGARRVYQFIVPE